MPRLIRGLSNDIDISKLLSIAYVTSYFLGYYFPYKSTYYYPFQVIWLSFAKILNCIDMHEFLKYDNRVNIINNDEATGSWKSN